VPRDHRGRQEIQVSLVRRDLSGHQGHPDLQDCRVQQDRLEHQAAPEDQVSVVPQERPAQPVQLDSLAHRGNPDHQEPTERLDFKDQLE